MFTSSDKHEVFTNENQHMYLDISLPDSTVIFFFYLNEEHNLIVYKT
jgi:hypothetical protein